MSFLVYKFYCVIMFVMVCNIVLEIINKILNKNRDLFGDNPKYEKINVGFTNTVYSVNDAFIVKICTNVDNEDDFMKEIEFYQMNGENEFIPKLYYYDIDKQNVPYFYEIIEKVPGVSLYHVWHTFSEEKREEIIRQLCTIMKKIHSNKGPAYDWENYLKCAFIKLYDTAKKLNLFGESQIALIDYAYSKFDKYLYSDDFVLVHNDLHFDNIFYNNGELKLIDFERSMYAPRDFELNIIYKMIWKPWKFASEETERLTVSSQYGNILFYIEKYYPELVSVQNLYQRLAIYDMVYYLEQLIENPNIKELMDDFLFATKTVAIKDELTFDNLETPDQLMEFMNHNIEYGWIDKDGNKHMNNLAGFRENYRISSIEEILKSGLVTCIEQAKLIKCFLDRIGLENKVFSHRSYETEDDFDKDVRMHCIVLFKDNDTWYHFEHSNRPKRGIHKYESVDKAIEDITKGFEEHGDIRKLTEIDPIPEGMSFKEFNCFVNEFDLSKEKAL